jgi:hypothetical protein
MQVSGTFAVAKRRLLRANLTTQRAQPRPIYRLSESHCDGVVDVEPLDFQHGNVNPAATPLVA